MKVHHLNCGSMNPQFTEALVCHVLLAEIDAGLALIDTGFGLQDIARPAPRLGPFRHVIRPALDPAETAAAQVQALGYGIQDVRHIVVTHFDVDHIGGLADFPDAAVHVTTAEVDGAVRSPSRRERVRYQSAQWDHGPRLVEHTPDGEAWRGFAAAQELSDIAPGIVLLALPGHTRGHAAVAVESDSGWTLHAGDAFYHRGTLDGHSPVPRALRLMEGRVAYDLERVKDNHRRLAELHQRGDADLLIVSAHDPVLLETAQKRELR